MPQLFDPSFTVQRSIAATFVLSVVSLAWAGCVLPFGSDSSGDGSITPGGECSTDDQCGSGVSCQVEHCVNRQCQSSPAADGTMASDYTSDEPACEKVVCDGKGGTRNVADPTNVPTGAAVACKRATCDTSGTVEYTPDPSNTPPDEPHDCKRDSCASDGTITYVPDPTDLPTDSKGDCKKPTCDASGTEGSTPDDSDTPPATTCFSYTCSDGAPVGTPINPNTVCSAEGFACGADGSCTTCPTPDATCTSSGPGSRTATSAYDFAGIGRTDSGGRWVCGAVPSGAAEYYTYYDDGTGFLASFDPYFEIEPQAPAQMCVYFDCPSIACPGGTTASSSGGHPGCCLDAPAGVFTGANIGFCDGARVNISVTTTSTCAGYELHFHD